MVRAMWSKRSMALACGLACVLSACGGLGLRAKGSQAIAEFLAAAQRDDRRAFEAMLDRPALRADLGGQVSEVGKSHAVDVGDASEFALDRMVTPQAVEVIAARTASGWPAAPTPAQIVPRMKAHAGQVCLEEAGSHRCLLTFAERDGRWRLVGMLFTPPPAEAPPETPPT